VRATDRGSDRTVRHTVATPELHPTVMRCPGRPTVQRNATLAGDEMMKQNHAAIVNKYRFKENCVDPVERSDSDHVTDTCSNLNRNH